MKKGILLFVALFFTTFAHAIDIGGIDSGAIRSLQVSNDGAITFFVQVQSGQSALPACATLNRYAILDENSRAGRHQFALLIPAAADSNFFNMRIKPTGFCTRLAGYGDVEYVER